MKTAEELKAIKAEYESLKRKLAELTEEEIHLITAGSNGEFAWKVPKNPSQYEINIYNEDPKKFK